MALHPNGIYHIYNHAIGDDNLFRSEDNYAYFLKRYAYFIHPIAKTYAYCLMPNHFHLLVKIRNEKELTATFPKFLTLEKLISKQYSNFFSSYTQSFNKVYQRRGSLFIKNFKRKQISDANFFTSVIQYIHHNPVHHGFCTSIDGWKWSSYHTILSDRQTLLEKNEVINYFGSQMHFRRVHQNYPQNYAELASDDFY